jgi:hypothetical protein
VKKVFTFIGGFFLIYLIARMIELGCSRQELAPGYILTPTDMGIKLLQPEGGISIVPCISAYDVEEKYILVKCYTNEINEDPQNSVFYIVTILPPNPRDPHRDEQVSRRLMFQEFDSLRKELDLPEPDWQRVIY